MIVHDPTEQPCRNCRARKNECSYPVRDRSLTVPESYLRRLETELRHFKDRTATTDARAGNGSGSRTPARAERLVENSSAEQFVRKLRELYAVHPSSNDQQVTSPGNASSTSQGPRSADLGESYPQHNYAPLQFDELRRRITFD